MKKKLALAALAATACARPNWNGTFASATTAPTGFVRYGTDGANATSCNETTLDSTVGTTVYLPTTVTMTTMVYETSSSSDAAAAAAAASEASSSSPPPVVSTTTVEYTVTTTMTLPDAEANVSPTGPYSFVFTSGSTSWLNGMSPDANLPVTTATSSVTYVPVPSTPSESDSFTTVRSTLTTTSTTTVQPSASSEALAPMSTLTASPLSSTVFSYSPESTTTLSSTQYSTITLSRVMSPSSFAGTNTDGWNATSSQAAPDQSALAPQPITTTETQLVVLNMSSTAATSTMYLTTTIGATITQTFYPSAIASGGSTALTGEPVTLTRTIESEPTSLSTSMALAEAASGSSSSSIAPIPVPSSSLASASVSITSTIAASTSLPLGLPDTMVSTPAAYSVGTPSSNSFSSSSSTTRSWTMITLTSFVSGHGTTMTVNSTTIGTTPMSPGFNSTSATSPSTSGISITSVMGDQSTTILIASTTRMSPSSNSTSNVKSQSSASSASTQPTTSSSASTPTLSQYQVTTVQSPAAAHTSSSTSGNMSTFKSLTSLSTSKTVMAPSQSTSSHTSLHTSSSSTVSSSNGTSSVPVSQTSSSSSFSNPFPPHSATATPSAGCGEQGKFTMTFDDLPRFTPTKRQSWNSSANVTDIGQYPPVTFNGRPYHHLYFSDGYVYAPQPAEPYSPISSPNVAAFANPMRTGWNKNSTGKNNVEPGEIGDAYNDDSPAFWFDANSAYLGCDNPGPEACTVEATGYAWSPQANDEVVAAAQNYTIPPCSRDCTMKPVEFSPAYRNLTGLQFRAFVGSRPRTFYVDDIVARWSNSSCAAGMTRQETR